MPDRDAMADDKPMGVFPVQQVYINGFQIGLSNADFSVIGMLDNQPNIKINMSYTIAKTLAVKVTEMMDKLEKATGRAIMTTDDAGAGLEEALKQ